MIKQFLKQIYSHRKSGTTVSQLKYFSKWKNSLKPEASSVKDQQPWITFQAIEFLRTACNSNSKVFEYGGGGSTLFFTGLAKEVVTIEHDKEWFKILSDVVKKKSISNWNGNLLTTNDGNLVNHPSKSDPEHYSSGDLNSKNKNYKDYVCSIDKFNDGYFDFVLVDGRSRASCIKHSLPKLKKNGYLIVDNSDRQYYFDAFKETLNKDFQIVLNGFGATPYLQHFTKTTIWKKK